jgi:hypothetical protein
MGSFLQRKKNPPQKKFANFFCLFSFEKKKDIFCEKMFTVSNLHEEMVWDSSKSVMNEDYDLGFLNNGGDGGQEVLTVLRIHYVFWGHFECVRLPTFFHVLRDMDYPVP